MPKTYLVQKSIEEVKFQFCIEINIFCSNYCKVIFLVAPCIDCKKQTMQGFFMKDYIEERAIEIANYIIIERFLWVVD